MDNIVYREAETDDAEEFASSYGMAFVPLD